MAKKKVTGLIKLQIEAGMAHTDRIEAFVEDAVDKGATVLTGATRLGPTMYAPTVLASVPSDARLHTEEVFGPVVYVEVVDSLDEATARANASTYGLNASVWAAPATGRRIATQLECGTVNINEGYGPAWSAMDAPMGGWKRSGAGRRHGEHGITKYTEPRNVTQTRWVNLVANDLPRERLADAAAATLRFGRSLLR